MNEIVSKDPTWHCRVCGLFQGLAQYGVNGRNPTHEICLCCGVEFGYEDMTPTSARRYRAEWIENGANWFNPKFKPENWKLEDQLANVAEEFR